MVRGLWLFLILTGPALAAPLPRSVRRTPVVEAVERTTPAVVAIETEQVSASPFSFFGPEVSSAAGSGVIIHSSGLVVTNAHVVDGARSIAVYLSDGRSFPAELVAQDAEIDLAVLRLDGHEGLPVMPLGDSDDLMLGETAIALGNPFGLGLTVSTGVISSVGRDVNVGQGPSQTYIQTDAAINPGNSGGALINLAGELVGINTFIFSEGEGIGFAIPVNRVDKIVSDLLLYGRVRVPWLGAGLFEVDPRRHRVAQPGLWVDRVYVGSPAEQAGLQPGDLITSVGGHPVRTRSDLHARLAELNMGTRYQLAVVRNGQASTLGMQARPAPEDLGASILDHSWKIDVAPFRGGLQVTRVAQGNWTKANLREGDVIVGVEGLRVRTEEELQDRLRQAQLLGRAAVWVQVVRGMSRGALEVEL